MNNNNNNNFKKLIFVLLVIYFLQSYELNKGHLFAQRKMTVLCVANSVPIHILLNKCKFLFKLQKTKTRIKKDGG